MLVGIDIGGTKCAVIQGESQTDIQHRVSFPTGSANATIERMIKEIAKLGRPDAIGISCGGPLDEENGVIFSPPNLPGWDAIPLAALLHDRFGVPVKIRNDANACALAEYHHGAGKGTKNMVFLTFGTGLGAGLILDGRLYGGTCGMAGEVGHIRLSKEGPLGYGKAGSFEGYCSGGGIARLGKALAAGALSAGEHPAYCPTHEALDSVTAKTIAECARAGDKTALTVFRQSGEMLGAGLAVLVDILNPEVIVIGSIYYRCEDLLFPHAQRVLAAEALPESTRVCRILPVALGERIGDIAALTVAAEALE